MNRLLLSATLLVVNGALAAAPPATNQQNSQKSANVAPAKNSKNNTQKSESPAPSTDKQGTAAAAAWIAGPQWVKQIDQDLKQGRFAKFLATADEWYKKGEEKKQWQPLADGDQQLTEKYNTPKGKQLFDEITGKVDQFEDELQALKKERDAALAKVAKEYPKAPISAVIQDRLKVPDLTKEQRQALRSFDEWMSPFPLHANTPLLQQLKAISFEYRVKEILLGAASQQGDKKNPELPDFGPMNEQTVQQYQIALTLEKLNKMITAAQKTNEKDLANNLAMVAIAYPSLIAEIHDGLNIEAMAELRQDDAQKKVADILDDFNAKRQALLHKYAMG